jgi:hypothetical protein
VKVEAIDASDYEVPGDSNKTDAKQQWIHNDTPWLAAVSSLPSYRFQEGSKLAPSSTWSIISRA